MFLILFHITFTFYRETYISGNFPKWNAVTVSNDPGVFVNTSNILSRNFVEQMVQNASLDYHQVSEPKLHNEAILIIGCLKMY